MTDVHDDRKENPETTTPHRETDEDEGSLAQKPRVRPDEAAVPGQTKTDPASSGEGAAGAGGSKGFGT